MIFTKVIFLASKDKNFIQNKPKKHEELQHWRHMRSKRMTGGADVGDLTPERKTHVGRRQQQEELSKSRHMRRDSFNIKPGYIRN